MTAQHTPGPWRVENHSTWREIVIYAFYSIGDYPIASINKRHTAKTASSPEIEGPMAEANARLIAAAPETAAERDRLKASNAELLAAATKETGT